MKFLLTLFTLLTFGHLFAVDYYVSPSGNDANSGLSGQPWQTLQFSVDQLQAGDVLHVMVGVYNEKLSINVSGTAAQPITIVGVWNSILDGTGITNQNALIEIVNQSHIIIDYLELRNNIMNDAQGILIDGACAGITLKNLTIHDIHFSANASDTATEFTNAQPIIVFGSDPLVPVSDLEISSNTIRDCRLGYSEGLAVNGNVDGFLIRNNWLYNLTNIGIVAIGHEGTCSDASLDQARNGTITGNQVYNCRSPYAACAGIYIDGAKKIVVERNSSRLNNYGIEIGCEHPGKSADSIMVRNNMVYVNDKTGLSVGGYDYSGLSGKVSRVKIYNNTLYKNDSLHDGNGDLQISYVEGCELQNNIFYTNNQERAITLVDTASGLFFDYNLYFTESGNQNELIDLLGTTHTLSTFQAMGNETNALFVDPNFLTFNMSDASLVFAWDVISPAVDQGNPALTATECGDVDYFGANRFFSIAPDMGAFEAIFNGVNEESSSIITVWPNPTSGEVAVVSPLSFSYYQLSDETGKSILSGNLVGNLLSIESIPAGYYFLQLTGESSVGIARVVKTDR